MMPDSSSFGVWLKRRRKALDLTQEALAKLVGCSVVSIRKFESDTQRPSRSLAELLATRLQIPQEEHERFVLFARLGLDATLPDLPLPIEAQLPIRPAQITAHAAASSPSHPNLPTPPTPLFGRERDIVSVCAHLHRPDTRLLTLTGPGGVGKTRLALACAQQLAATFRDGIHLVHLAPIGDPALVASTIAQALGVTEMAGLSPLERLRDFLRDRQLLLLIDNFEQVLPAALLLADLLAACSELKLLITSRATLHVSGEHEYPVAPLALPDQHRPTDILAIEASPAVTLFTARAQAARPDFVLTDTIAASVAEICHRLDGLPLAIELAAARVKLLPLQTLLARLEKRLPILTGGARDMPARQQTLRNTIVWSYDMLTAVEQILFRRLAVFIGGWTLDAAEVVCTLAIGPALEVLDSVQSLVDQSLLTRMEDGDDPPRFTMLETIREYALERLEAGGEAAVLRQQHAHYYLGRAEAAEPQLRGAAQRIWLRRLEADLNNLRTALAWSLSAQGDAEVALRLAAALWFFCILHGTENEGRAWLEGALERSKHALRPAAAVVRAKALFARGAQMQHIHGYGRPMPLLEESLALYRQLGDRHHIGMALLSMGRAARDQSASLPAQVLLEESLVICREQANTWGVNVALLSLGNTALDRGDVAQAITRFQESLALSRDVGDQTTYAWSLLNLGLAVAEQQNLERAMAICEEALALFRDLGIQPGLAQGRLAMGQVALAQGERAQAAEHFTESLKLSREQGNLRDIAYCLEGIATLTNAEQHYEHATRLFSTAHGLREAIDHPLPPYLRTNYARNVALAHAQLGDRAFAAAWETGRALALEQAIALALELAPTLALAPSLTVPPKPAAVSAAYPAGLTAREVEVLGLVAQGLSDARIAARLVISSHTVHAHLRAIYSKLEVRSRAAATRFAVEHHLV